MNEIRLLTGRETELVDCYSDEQISEFLEQIVVGVKTTNQFFDVVNYNNPEKPNFSYETLYVETSLNNIHGQLKQYFVEQHKT